MTACTHAGDPQGAPGSASSLAQPPSLAGIWGQRDQTSLCLCSPDFQINKYVFLRNQKETSVYTTATTWNILQRPWLGQNRETQRVRIGRQPSTRSSQNARKCLWTPISRGINIQNTHGAQRTNSKEPCDVIHKQANDVSGTSQETHERRAAYVTAQPEPSWAHGKPTRQRLSPAGVDTIDRRVRMCRRGTSHSGEEANACGHHGNSKEVPQTTRSSVTQLYHCWAPRRRTRLGPRDGCTCTCAGAATVQNQPGVRQHVNGYMGSTATGNVIPLIWGNTDQPVEPRFMK